MKKILVVVDYQKDFVDGSLGFKKAETLEEGIYSKIEEYLNNDDYVVFTYDTHYKNYLDTREGKKLPVEHCIEGSEGHELFGKIKEFKNTINTYHIYKTSFGIDPEEMVNLRKKLGEVDDIEIIGVVTDICVISNVVTFQSAYVNANIVVDSSLCASFDEDKHNKTLDIMKSLQVNIK